MPEPTFDAVATFDAVSGGSASPWALTLNVVANAAVVVVRVATRQQTVTGVTIDGSAMTALHTADTDAGFFSGATFQAKNISAGARAISVTLSGASDRGTVTAISAAGAILDATTFNTVTHSWGPIQTTTGPIASAVGELVIGGTDGMDGDSVTIAVSAPATQRANHLGGPGDGSFSIRQMVATADAAAPNVAINWVNTGSSPNDWGIWGVSIRGAPAAAGAATGMLQPLLMTLRGGTTLPMARPAAVGPAPSNLVMLPWRGIDRNRNSMTDGMRG